MTTSFYSIIFIISHADMPYILQDHYLYDVILSCYNHRLMMFHHFTNPPEQYEVNNNSIFIDTLLPKSVR